MKDLERLNLIIPTDLHTRIVESGHKVDDLRELVLDLNRNPVAYWTDNSSTAFVDLFVTQKLLHSVAKRIGKFGHDNRAAMDECLHRFSRIVNRENEMVGLTIRVGRALPDCADIIEDLSITGESVLLLGRPGTGKTSMLRAMAARLAEYGQRVIVVDTSNEIGGDGNVPHPALGFSRRMQVPFNRSQVDVMIEAVENHTPDVIIVDEISSYPEAAAARTIARRGVKLVATAHGSTIEDVLRNPPLTPLLGGVKAATLSDGEAQKRGSQKTIQEQEAPSTFDVVVEITSHTTCNVYRDLDSVVAAILSGGVYLPEQRQIDADGRVTIIRPQYIGNADLADIEKQFLTQKGSHETNHRQP